VAQVPPLGRGTGDVHWTAVRRLLVTDLVLRLLERRGVPARGGMLVEPGSVHGDQSWLDAVEADVHQTGGRVLPELPADQAAAADIRIASEQTGGTGILLAVPGRLDHLQPQELELEATGWTTFAEPERVEAGPLATRVDLLATPLHQPSWHTLESGQAAARRLLAWRQAAGGWRSAPPGRVAAAHLGAFNAALDQGLDTPRALGVLDTIVEDPTLRPGDKLATFTALDAFLGLALTIPRPPDRAERLRWMHCRPRRPATRPAWLGAPEDLLPGLTPLQLVLARTADTLVAVTNVQAYPTGVAFTVQVRLHSSSFVPTTGWMQRAHDQLFTFDSPDRDQILRLWVEDADGGRSGDPDTQVNPMDEAPPHQPLLQRLGGGGSEVESDAECWLWPLPPPGPLTFACTWPARGIPETKVTVPAAPIRRAADTASPRFL
jgi:hypothetical protein